MSYEEKKDILLKKIKDAEKKEAGLLAEAIEEGRIIGIERYAERVSIIGYIRKTLLVLDWASLPPDAADRFTACEDFCDGAIDRIKCSVEYRELISFIRKTTEQMPLTS